MPRRTLARTLIVALGAAAGAIGARAYVDYRRDIRLARARALAGSRVIFTACGPVEFAEAGSPDDPPVLVIHGIMGGYDQGLLTAAHLVSEGCRVIAASRFGYLRTPLPPDPSPTAQADAYAALLDELRIRRVAVVALSAGAPSALQFALRHPARCSALGLLSMAYRPSIVPTGWRATLVEAVLGSDFLFWWLNVRARGLLPLVVGPRRRPHPGTSRPPLSAEDRAFLAELRRTFLPVGARRPGIVNDLRILRCGSRPAYERIAAPCLVVHAVDDSLAPFTQARDAAARIPGARFVPVAGGGHFMLGRQEAVRAEVAGFLEACRLGAALP